MLKHILFKIILVDNIFYVRNVSTDSNQDSSHCDYNNEVTSGD